MNSKLYIPTSTLNFNNILASESISPAGFYAKRGFGYKRFEKVEPNNLEKRIVLYEKYPIFDIHDNELENYPLVIEIDTNTIGKNIIQDNAYFSEETIYLNPFSTKFYFRNDNEKRSVLSKAEQSLTTKMVSLYQNCFCIKPTNVEYFDWQRIEIADTKDDFEKHISKDRLKNKIKGFLYAYLLGSHKSLPSEVVALKKYAKDLRNVISAVITSADGQANDNQKKQINELYRSINESFYKAEVSDKGQKIIDTKVKQYHCENFKEILEGEGIFDDWLKKQGIQIQPFESFHFNKKTYDKKSEADSKVQEENQNYFDSYFSDLECKISNFIKQKNVSLEELPQIQDFSRIESVPKFNIAVNPEFLKKLFNEFLAENWNNEEFISSRLDFATAGGKLFKEQMKNEWENSKYQKYINDLRYNLASHTPFEVTNTDNLTLQSFAAFCQKGEDDIDKLEDYLISNYIGDFRIAFALWGIVFGFANMPKTLTNELFLSEDLEYISKIYK